LGAVVGELRDADVMIEEMIQPAAEQTGGCSGLMSALDMWREGVRARVRRGLLAARAPVFAAELQRMCEHRAHSRAVGESPFVAGALANAAVEAATRRAVARGRRISELAPTGRHELRKDVKNWRYAVELAAAIAPDHRAAALIGPLKRLQSALGRLNDLTMLAQFDPPLPSEGQRKALRGVRKKILAINAEGADAALTDAAARWRWIERACTSGMSRKTRD
jgi:CHAD domain-containing protein